ncbi:MAG: hypothetical protein ACXU86_04020 [Archangium sp.]
MFRKLLVLAAALAASSAFADDINIDIRNNGPDAYDFAVILSGVETVNWTFNGPYNGQTFGQVTKVQVGTDTLIHWQNPSLGVIAAGSVFHIGWTTTDHTSQIKDMYFTDKFGQRIMCSQVKIVGSHPIHPGFPGGVAVFENALAATDTIAIRNPRFVVFDQPQPLAALNSQNQEIMGQLRPLTGDFTVRPGETVQVQLPVIPTAGQGVLLVYDTNGAPDSAADITVFVQGTADTAPQAATLKTRHDASQRR